jgi:nucleoside-diphosphate-sugar epimerase
MEKILVTGGNGFVAKSLINYLRKINYDTWFLSRSKSDDPKSFQLDFTNPSEITKVIKNHCFDIIVHAAAHIPEPENRKDLELCQKVNFNGTSNILQFAVTNNIKKFVYLSSISVFNGCSESIIDEETTPCPNSEYAISKLSAEYLCRYFADTYNIKIPILRIGTVYGLGMNESRMINYFIERCKNNDKLEVYNANMKLHTVYIKDVVEVISKIMHRDSEVYHLVENTLTKEEIVKVIAKCSNSKSDLTFKINTYKYPLSFSKTKLRSILVNNKAPFHDFESGIKDFLKQ